MTPDITKMAHDSVQEPYAIILPYAGENSHGDSPVFYRRYPIDDI